MRSNKWLILGLVLSIGANIALIGFIAGRASHLPPVFSPDPTVGFMRILPDLPETRRAELRGLTRRHMRAVVPGMRQMRQAQGDLRQAILADPFDEQALEATLQALRQHLGTVQVASHAGFVRLVAALTPAERQRLAEVMQRRRHGPPGFRREGHPGDGRMSSPPKMESTGVGISIARPVRRPLPGGQY